MDHEVLGNNYRICEVYSPEPRIEVYCFRLNINISKLEYFNWRVKETRSNRLVPASAARLLIL